MSLDTVELVMEVEEEFNITIADEDAERIRTVGDLYRQVVCKLGLRDPRSCLSAAAFYRFRRASIEQLGLSRDAVRPGRPVQDLLPGRDPRSIWSTLGERLGWRLPPLVRPAWMRWTAAVVSLLLCIWTCALPFLVLPRRLLIEPHFGQGIVILSVLTAFAGDLLFWIAAERLTRRWAVLVPASSRTVRSLIGESLRLNYGTITEQVGAPAPDPAIWERVQAIICTQMGVAPYLVAEETSFDEFL